MTVIGITTAILVALLFFLSAETASLITTLIILLPLAATLTALAFFSHETSKIDWLILLILLVFGLAFMMLRGNMALPSLSGILITLIVLLIRQNKRSRFSALWGIGLYGFALAALLFSFVLPPAIGQIALFLAYAILLPLFPLHGANIVTFGRLSGILPGFLALLLPALGLKGMLILLPELSPALLNVVSILALCGALYGGIRAGLQCNISHRLAYAGLTFWSILWWYLARTGIESAPAILYFTAFALGMQGFFLCWHLLEARYGELNLDKLGGLARTMPRFGLLLGLLVVAAVGLPFFAPFTALLAMATSSEITLSWDFSLILLAWFLASWHFPLLMQRMLWGPPQTGRRHRDLVPRESISLAVIVAMIVILGIAPYTFIAGSLQTQKLLAQNVQALDTSYQRK